MRSALSTEPTAISLHAIRVQWVYPRCDQQTAIAFVDYRAEGSMQGLESRPELHTQRGNPAVGHISESTKPGGQSPMVLLAVWCGTRCGELRELRRKDVSGDGTVIHIRRGVVLLSGRQIVEPTKSDAGVRDVDVPPYVVPRVLAHMDTYVADEPDALLFPASGDRSEHMRSSTLANAYGPAQVAAGRPDLRWHDLRHTGAMLAVAEGASLKEVMDRLGHSTVQASFIYQHAAEGRGKAIAARLSEITLGD